MITRTGVAFVAMGIVAVAVGLWLNLDELLVLGLGLLACLLFAVAWQLLRPNVEVSRVVAPDRISEGEVAHGLLTVTNSSRRRNPAFTALESFADRLIEIHVPGLAAGAQSTTSYELPGSRRGYYAVGPLEVGRSDPLRLFDLTHQHASDAKLWVHPRIHRMPEVPTGHTQEIDGPTLANSPQGGVAFHSLREYEPGDDLRLIHWKSTARAGDLMVRHTVVTNEPKILVVLDSSAEAYPEAEVFEDAVRVAASLVIASSQQHYPVDFRSTGGLSASVDPAGKGRTTALDQLALVEMSDGDQGLAELVNLAARREQGVSAAFVTGQPDHDRAATIGRVRGRFQMVSVAQLGEKFDRPGLAITGVVTVTGDTSEDLARNWKARLG